MAEKEVTRTTRERLPFPADDVSASSENPHLIKVWVCTVFLLMARQDVQYSNRQSEKEWRAILLVILNLRN